MPTFTNQMSPTERRVKARKVRALLRNDGLTDKHTVEQAGAAHGLSRAHAYRIIEELEAWELTVSMEREAEEVNAQFKTYHPLKWMLCSGRTLLAYNQGAVSPSLLNGNGASDENISVDPMLL